MWFITQTLYLINKMLYFNKKLYNTFLISNRFLHKNQGIVANAIFQHLSFLYPKGLGGWVKITFRQMSLFMKSI